MSIYDFEVKAQNGSNVALSDYKGKVLLIVNTATGCGFTPQYEELQDIYDAYKDNGLEILDFPCNQFGEQTPGDDEEIHSSCTDQLAKAVRAAYNSFSEADYFKHTAREKHGKHHSSYLTAQKRAHI